MSMSVCEAVKLRIVDLLEEQKITLYRLEQNAGILHGTMMGIMQLRNKSVNLAIIIQIADGFGMPVAKFLDSPLFDRKKFDL